MFFYVLIRILLQTLSISIMLQINGIWRWMRKHKEEKAHENQAIINHDGQATITHDARHGPRRNKKSARLKQWRVDRLWIQIF